MPKENKDWINADISIAAYAGRVLLDLAKNGASHLPDMTRERSDALLRKHGGALVVYASGADIERGTKAYKAAQAAFRFIATNLHLLWS